MSKKAKKRMSCLERRIDALEAAAVKLDMRLAAIKERGDDVVYFVFAPRSPLSHAARDSSPGGRAKGRFAAGFRERVHYWRCARRGEWMS